MDFIDYLDEVRKRESRDFDRTADRLSNVNTLRLLHATLGVADEAGELAGAVKKYLYYGSELDFTNVVEELGDCLWFLTLACDSLGTTMSYVMERNVAKLHKRYGDTFSDDRANNRDRDAERRVLEGEDDREDV